MGSKLEGILSLITLPAIGIAGFLVMIIKEKLNRKDTK